MYYAQKIIAHMYVRTCMYVHMYMYACTRHMYISCLYNILRRSDSTCMYRTYVHIMLYMYVYNQEGMMKKVREKERETPTR